MACSFCSAECEGNVCENCAKERRCRCAHCRKWGVRSVEIKKYGTNLFCKECSENVLAKCCSCGKKRHRGEMSTTKNGKVCQVCYNKLELKQCSQCGIYVERKEWDVVMPTLATREYFIGHRIESSSSCVCQTCAEVVIQKHPPISGRCTCCDAIGRQVNPFTDRERNITHLCDRHMQMVRKCCVCSGDTFHDLCENCRDSHVNCRECGKFFKKDGNDLCIECRGKAGKCPCCEQEAILKHKSIEGFVVCRRCHSNYMRTCAMCKKQSMFARTSGVCPKCRHENRMPLMEAYNYSPPIFIKKGEGTMFFGVENELSFPTTKYQEQALIYAATKFNPLDMYTQHDGSVVNGVECVVHPRTYEWYLENDKFVENMFLSGCQQHSSAGMHVHMSRSGFTRTTLLKFMTFIAVHKEFINHVAERQPDEGGRSWKNTPTSILRQKAKGIDVQDKYVDVNIKHRETIEVRIFAGAVESTRFYKNLQFCHALWSWCCSCKLSDIKYLSKFYEYVKHNYGILWDHIKSKEPIDVDDITFKQKGIYKYLRQLPRYRYGRTGNAEIDSGRQPMLVYNEVDGVSYCRSLLGNEYMFLNSELSDIITYRAAPPPPPIFTNGTVFSTDWTGMMVATIPTSNEE